MCIQVIVSTHLVIVDVLFVVVCTNDCCVHKRLYIRTYVCVYVHTAIVMAVYTLVIVGVLFVMVCTIDCCVHVFAIWSVCAGGVGTGCAGCCVLVCTQVL